jgi:alkaline phosphatase D
MKKNTKDDHDYGLNNGGAEYTDKKESQKILLNFLEEPGNSPRWNREGVYGSYIFGPPGKRLQIVNLDARYFRDRIGNYSGDILGAAQWKWLEEKMKAKDIQFRIITSGIQFLPLDKPFQEKWAQFPNSRKRLMELIGKSETPTILLSGDVHYAEIHRSDCTGIGYPLYELTSSGMTHCMASQAKIPGLGKWILDNIFYSDFRVGSSYEFYNFGSVQVLWDRNPVEVVLQAHAINGTVVLEQRLNLEELKRNRADGAKFLCQEPEPDELAIIPVESIRDTILFLILLVVLVLVVVFCITKCSSKDKQQQQQQMRKKKN